MQNSSNRSLQKRLEAIQKLERIFSDNAIDKKQSLVKFRELWKHAEASRFSVYVSGALNKRQQNAKYQEKDLREDIVREMRILRAVCNKEEGNYIPKPLFEACSKVLWGGVRQRA